MCCFSLGKRRNKGHVADTATWLARRAVVVELVHLGYSYQPIAATKRVRVGLIADAVKRYKETKPHSDRLRSSGRPEATPTVSKQVVSMLRDSIRQVGSVRKARAELRGEDIHLSRYNS